MDISTAAYECCKKVCTNFVDGSMSADDFVDYCIQNPETLDWLTSIAGKSSKISTIVRNIDRYGYPKYRVEKYDFDAKKEFETILNDQAHSKLDKYLSIHSLFCQVLIKAFPTEEIKIDDSLDKKFNFMIDACPEYIGGPEVEDYLEQLYNSIPYKLSMTSRKAQYRMLIRKEFHITYNRRPYWNLNPDWPMHNGKPMEFVEQRNKQGKQYSKHSVTEFIFRDVTSGHIRVVEQLH